MSYFPRVLAAPAAKATPVVEWEETDCLLCGGRNGSPLVEAPDSTPGGSGLWFVVVQCQDCGLCYTNPRPSPSSIGQFYPSCYAPHQTPGLLDRLRRLPGRSLAGWLRPRGERRYLPLQGRGRLLDFGCGGGSFLDRMQRQGWEVLGLDTSAAAVQRIRTTLGLRALVGTLPHPHLEPGSFDVVTMWHSLEHVHDPMAVLKEAHRLLAPGGKLVVAVPNIDSLAFRWFGHAWFALDLPRHLTHFAPWTLHLMLQRAGFRVGPVRMVRHSEWLRASARLACRAVTRPTWRRWLTVKPTARLATLYSAMTLQADSMQLTAFRER